MIRFVLSLFFLLVSSSASASCSTFLGTAGSPYLACNAAFAASYSSYGAHAVYQSYNNTWQCQTSSGGMMASMTCTNPVCSSPNVINKTVGSPDYGKCVPDVVLDDCSTNIATMGADLSGSSTDGSCSCPSSQEMLHPGTSQVACFVPCSSGQIRNSSDVCVSACSDPYIWDGSACSCPSVGYQVVTDYSGHSYCINSADGGGGATAANTAAAASSAAATAASAAAMASSTAATAANTAAIKDNTAAMAASAAAGAASAAAGAASQAATAAGTATIATASQATAANTAAAAENTAAAAAASQAAATASQATASSVESLAHDSSAPIPSAFAGHSSVPDGSADLQSELDGLLDTFKTKIAGFKAGLSAEVGLTVSSAASCPAYHFTALGRTYDIDLCQYSNVWDIIRAALLMMTAAISIMIVFGRGGSK